MSCVLRSVTKTSYLSRLAVNFSKNNQTKLKDLISYSQIRSMSGQGSPNLQFRQVSTDINLVK